MKSIRFDFLLLIRRLLAFVVWRTVGFKGEIPAVLNIPGRTAVWIFFGISGYVISYGFLTNGYLLTLSDLKKYYLNRFLRIWPLFFTISMISLTASWLQTGYSPLKWIDIPQQIFMLQFNHAYLLNGVFWTLGIEVQFYILSPLLALIIFKVATTKHEMFMQAMIYGRNVISNLSHFFICMVGCRFILKHEVKSYNKPLLLLIVILLFFTTNFLYQHHPFIYYSAGNVIIDALIFALILLHARLQDVVNGSKLIPSTFLFFGLVSYGIYAWHTTLGRIFPAIATNLLVITILSIAVSYASYKLIEKPALRFKRHRKVE